MKKAEYTSPLEPAFFGNLYEPRIKKIYLQEVQIVLF